MTEYDMVGWNHGLDGHEFEQGSSVHGVLQAEILEWVTISSYMILYVNSLYAHFMYM